MIKTIIIILITIVAYNLNSQQFGPEVVIANNLIYSFPSIDLDSNGNIGIIWGVNGYPDDTVKFIKSYDGGISFNIAKTVDILPYHPDAGYPKTPLLLFDSFDNPIVFYVRWYFPFSYYHHYKKSNDGGNSFPQNRFTFHSRSDLVDFLFLGTDTTLLGYSYYSTQNVMVKRSINAGLSYVDSTLVYTGNSSPQRKILLARCGNGNILCFYSQYNTSNTRINYNRSEDMGLTFSTNTLLDSTYQYHSCGMINTYQNYVFVISTANGDTITPKIVFYKSDDFGHSFTEKKVIYDYGNITLNTWSEPTMVFNPNVGLCLVWNQYSGLLDKTWFSYSDDLGTTFNPPVIVTEGDQWVTNRSMAVSDSGDVYISYINNTIQSIVLRKAKLPVLTNIYSSRPRISPDLILLNNYPNPFNSATQISYNIPAKGMIYLTLYDIRGRKVRTLLKQILDKGLHNIRWNGKDDFNHEVSSGIYYCYLKTQQFNLCKKLIYIK